MSSAGDPRERLARWKKRKFSESEKRHLAKIALFSAGMVVLGMLTMGLIILIARKV
jgi:hypothetical protein